MLGSRGTRIAVRDGESSSLRRGHLRNTRNVSAELRCLQVRWPASQPAKQPSGGLTLRPTKRLGKQANRTESGNKSSPRASMSVLHSRTRLLASRATTTVYNPCFILRPALSYLHSFLNLPCSLARSLARSLPSSIPSVLPPL